jgi:hypothetical protein
MLGSGFAFAETWSMKTMNPSARYRVFGVRLAVSVDPATLFCFFVKTATAKSPGRPRLFREAKAESSHLKKTNRAVYAFHLRIHNHISIGEKDAIHQDLWPSPYIF